MKRLMARIVSCIFLVLSTKETQSQEKLTPAKITKIQKEVFADFENGIVDSLPYRLVRHKTEAWHVEIACNHGPFEGTVLFPVPPDDPGQQILASRLVLENGTYRKIANVVNDRNTLRQPVYQIETRETSNFRVIADVDVQFYDCALQFDDIAPSPNLSKPICGKSLSMMSGIRKRNAPGIENG